MVEMTKREKFAAMADVLVEAGAPEELVEFVGREVALLEKKASAPRTKTKGQVENEGLKTEVVEMLAGKAMTATEVADALKVSVQKASALLRQLVASGEVSRTEAKGKVKATFSVTVL